MMLFMGRVVGYAILDHTRKEIGKNMTGLALAGM
jgi:hypothetical protein